VKDKEHLAPSKNLTSTERATKHHLQPRLLAALCERVLMQNAEARLLFAVEIKRILAEDPAFAEAFADAFAPPRRGPRPAAATSPLATIVQNVATFPDYVATLAENVGNVSPKVATFSQGEVGPSRGAPAPQVPPRPPLPSPLRGEDNHSLQPTAAIADPAHAGRRDECFERMADGLYPGINGDYDRLTGDARGKLNHALAQLRAKMDEQGIPTEKRPGAITFAITRLPNYARNRTPGTLVKYWQECLAGADRDGRDGGLEIRRYVNHTGTVKHQSRMGLE
jgi:hypothetical protein